MKVRMKKDFTQQFEQDPLSGAHLLVEDAKSGSFLLIRSLDNHEKDDEYYREDYYYLPYTGLNQMQDSAIQLVKFLSQYNVALQSYRQLEKKVTLQYSFLDDTAGTKIEASLSMYWWTL